MKDECTIYEDLLVQEALGETSEKERAFLKAHLARCSECRKALAVLSDTVGVFRREGPSAAPAGLAERTFHRIGSAGDRLTAAASSFEGTELFRPSTWRVRKSLVGWMVAASLLVMAVASLVPDWMGTGDSRKIAVCQQRLRIVATALRQYAVEHDGVYPQGPEWYKALDREYLRSQGAFTCPARIAVGQPSKAEVDYVYNPERISIHSGHDYPLLWDRKGRHDRLGRNVVFANGHVVWVDEDKFLVLLASYKVDETEAY